MITFDSNEHKKKLDIITGVFLVYELTVFVSIFIPGFELSCEPIPYPTRWFYILFVNFVISIANYFIWRKIPKVKVPSEEELILDPDQS